MYLFDQGFTIIYPVISYHESVYTATTENTINFDHGIKVIDNIKWIKFTFAQYENNSIFGTLISTFPNTSIPKNTHVLCSVLSPKIKHISEKFYWYQPHYCYNSAP